MTSKWFTSLISGVALLGVTLTSALPAPAEQAPDKSGPGVARVSILDGSAVVQRGDSNKQVAAVVNAPLLPGDYISTGATSRAEVQFDGSSAVRLGGNVQARITANDRNNRQLQLADGTLEFGLVRNDDEVTVETPSATVRSNQTGDYRVSIGKDGSTWVTTRRGSAEVVTPQRTYTLESGRTLVARGSASNPSITYASEVGYDSFDDFNAKRDQTMVSAISASPRLNPDIAGYDNLGAYGQWQDVPGYGNAWVPDQSSNWSPYNDGNWSWEDGYGYTWVGNEPWGWAPYHYGRWFYANGYGWAWYPPPYYGYPSWSPALVGFFGFGVGGPGWNVSVGFGYPYIGWYPLAPYAPFYPWYPGWAWTGYGWGWPGWGCCGWGGSRVRIVSVTNITNIYRNYPHGSIHGTTIDNFRHGTIHGNTFAVTSGNIGGHVGMIHGALAAAPTSGSLGFGGRTLHTPVMMSKAFDSPRFASNRALAARPSFDQQQRDFSRAIESSARNTAPVTHNSAVESRNNAVDSRNNAIESRGANAPTTSWQRFDQNRGVDGRNENGFAAHPDRVQATGGNRADSNGANRVESNGGRTDFNAARPETNASTVRTDRVPSDSWSRFSNERGNVPVTYGNRDNYAPRSDNSPARSTTGRNPYAPEGYSRDPYASSRSSAYPSYSRGSAYPSYSHSSSYPSYSRSTSYPSYSRSTSYPSYSRGSSPSYSRAPEPSYSRGNAGGYSAPRPSSGGGAGQAHSGGGGGDRHGGGGRPPQ